MRAPRHLERVEGRRGELAPVAARAEVDAAAVQRAQHVRAVGDHGAVRGREPQLGRAVDALVVHAQRAARQQRGHVVRFDELVVLFIQQQALQSVSRLLRAAPKAFMAHNGQPDDANDRSEDHENDRQRGNRRAAARRRVRRGRVRRRASCGRVRRRASCG